MVVSPRVAVVVPIDVVPLDVEVHAAGVVVGLYVERDGLGVRGRVELELRVLVVATSHVLADVDADRESVRHVVLHVNGQFHGVVALLDLRPLKVPLVDAVPFSSRVVLLAIVLMAGPVWLPVAVLVPVVVPAKPVESVLLAVVEVIHVVFHLVLLAVHGQGEYIGSLARSVVVEVLALLRPVVLEVPVGVPIPVSYV